MRLRVSDAPKKVGGWSRTSLGATLLLLSSCLSLNDQYQSPTPVESTWIPDTLISTGPQDAPQTRVSTPSQTSNPSSGSSDHGSSTSLDTPSRIGSFGTTRLTDKSRSGSSSTPSTSFSTNLSSSSISSSSIASSSFTGLGTSSSSSGSSPSSSSTTTSNTTTSSSSTTTSLGHCPASTAYLCYASNEQASTDLNIRVNFTALATALPKDASTLQVARVEFFTGGSSSGHLLRVYQDNQGAIGSQVQESGFTSQAGASWYGANISPPRQVSPQAPLWFAWFPAQSTYASQASSGTPVPGLLRSAGTNWSTHSPLLKMRVYCCS